jgi:hypothetical protein
MSLSLLRVLETKLLGLNISYLLFYCDFFSLYNSMSCYLSKGSRTYFGDLKRVS